MTSQHKQHLLLGVFFAALSALCAALMSLEVKIIGQRATIDTILFARYVVSFSLIFPWVMQKPLEAVKLTQPKQIFSRSLFTLLSAGFFFYALKYISLANALVLNYTYPLFVPLVVWWFYKIKTSRTTWIGIFIGFIGIIMVIKPDSGFLNVPALVALTSGITAAIAIVLIRTLTKTVSTLQILFYNFLIALVVTGLLLPFFGNRITSDVFGPLLLMGVFAIGYQIFSTLALAKAQARLVSPVMFLAVVFGVVADFIYWDRLPDLWSLIGTLGVIIGGSIAIFFSQRPASPPISGK